MEMEKLLEDSVPCRVRAKRGCATHPRSIAERVSSFSPKSSLTHCFFQLPLFNAQSHLFIASVTFFTVTIRHGFLASSDHSSSHLCLCVYLTFFTVIIRDGFLGSSDHSSSQLCLCVYLKL